jgi:hypothetical protein
MSSHIQSGTGKSFIGALLAKALYEFTGETILLVCFKNHALDQFLEDLLDIGVPESAMLRLGGKSTTRTEPMSLFNISRSSTANYKFKRDDWTEIDGYKVAITAADDALKTSANRFMNTSTDYRDIMDLIEFDDDEYYYALKVLPLSDGMQRVTKKGKAIGPHYLINQWVNGWDADSLRDAENVQETQEIWGMPLAARKRKYNEWRESLLKEQAERISEEAGKYNDAHSRLARKYDERNLEIVRARRIIACTTTAAAMYRNEIAAASPDVLIVEEACEILESHVITALAEDTKQVIMIGDHKSVHLLGSAEVYRKPDTHLQAASSQSQLLHSECRQPRRFRSQSVFVRAPRSTRIPASDAWKAASHAPGDLPPGLFPDISQPHRCSIYSGPSGYSWHSQQRSVHTPRASRG